MPPRKKPERIEFEARQLAYIPGAVTIWSNGQTTWIRVQHLQDEIGEGMKLDRQMFNEENS